MSSEGSTKQQRENFDCVNNFTVASLSKLGNAMCAQSLAFDAREGPTQHAIKQRDPSSYVRAS